MFASLFTLLAIAIPNPALGEPSSASPIPQQPSASRTGWDEHHEVLERNFRELADQAFVAYDKNHDRRFDGRDWALMSPAERDAFGLWVELVREFSSAAAAGTIGPTWYQLHTPTTERVRRGFTRYMRRTLEAFYKDPRHLTTNPFLGLNLYVERMTLAPIIYGHPTVPTFAFDAASFRARWQALFPKPGSQFALHVVRGGLSDEQGMQRLPEQHFALSFGPQVPGGHPAPAVRHRGAMSALGPEEPLELIAIEALQQTPADRAWVDGCCAALLQLADPSLTPKAALALLEEHFHTNDRVPVGQVRGLEKFLGRFSVRRLAWSDHLSFELTPEPYSRCLMPLSDALKPGSRYWHPDWSHRPPAAPPPRPDQPVSDNTLREQLE